MGRVSLVVVLFLAFVVAACGGGGSAPAVDPGASGGGGAPVGGDFPPLSTVIFGSGYDASTLAITGRAKSVKAGSPLVAVGRILAPRPASEVTVQVTSPSAPRVDPIPVSASAGDPSDLFAVDLTSLNLAPGTWIVNYVSPNNRILASGNLAITP